MDEMDVEDQSNSTPSTSKCKKKRIHEVSLRHCHCYEVYEEEESLYDWKWQRDNNSMSVLLSNDKKDVCFHPFYSSGTAVVKGDTLFEADNHYYWEIQFLSELYGTDVVSQKYVFLLANLF